jgi:spore maturation protein SpmA
VAAAAPCLRLSELQHFEVHELSHRRTGRADVLTVSRLTSCLQLVPCAVLALISHPSTRHAFINRVMWAFCVYVEAVSVAPQVVMMQRNKTVEKFTGHYVFFLGVSRFFSCAHWILQMVDGRSSALWQVRTKPAFSLQLHTALLR